MKANKERYPGEAGLNSAFEAVQQRLSRFHKTGALPADLAAMVKTATEELETWAAQLEVVLSGIEDVSDEEVSRKAKPPAKPPDPKSEGAAARAAGAEPWENPYPAPTWEELKWYSPKRRVELPYFAWIEGYNGGKDDNE